MKTNLRIMFAALLMMFGMTAMAEDIIWSEDWSSYEANDVPSSGNANYAQEGSGTKVYSANLAGGIAPELLIAKNGGSFTATIALNGKSGELTLSYMANYDRITVTCEGATLGEKTNTGNNYTMPVTVAAGTQSIKLIFSNSTSSNVRFDDAKLYQGTAKKNAGLSWGTASRQVTIGSEDNVFPTLSNENNLTVIYSSSEETVATINNSGDITLVAAGQTIISAAFDGNDEYEAQTVSYTLTVKENNGEGGEGGEGGETTTTITVAQALEIIAGLEDGAKTDGEYSVEGFIVVVEEWAPKTAEGGYGNATFQINDEAGNTTNTLTVYRAKNANGDFTGEDAPLAVGEKVIVCGKLQKFVKNGVVTPEVATGGKVISRSTSTAISTMKASVNEGVVYNLQGQQVMQPTKGMYIINGKKVILK